jgi:hypothetical protein
MYEAQGLQNLPQYLELIAVARKQELVGLEDSTKALKERLWAMQDEKAVNDAKHNTNALRMQELELMGENGGREYLSLLNNQRRLEVIGMKETDIGIQRRIWALQDEKTAIASVTAAVSKTVDYALNAANAMKDIQGGSLSTDSPQERYRKAKDAFAGATASNAPELAKAFLTASQQYNASRSAYQSDYQQAMNKLGGISGSTINPVDQQITLLQSIRDALTDGTLPYLKQLKTGDTITNIINNTTATVTATSTAASLNAQDIASTVSTSAQAAWQSVVSFLGIGGGSNSAGNSANWPTYDGGGGYAQGTAFVPYDMETKIHQGEIIMDRASSDVLRKYGIPTTGRADNSDLVAELRALREEVKQLRSEQQSGMVAIAGNTGKTAKRLDRWDGDGMPAIRDAA